MTIEEMREEAEKFKEIPVGQILVDPGAEIARAIWEVGTEVCARLDSLVIALYSAGR